MGPVSSPRPEPAHDPLAVALGNASLLGVGYLMMRRPMLALGTGVITYGLLVVLAMAVRATWFEVLVLVWWAALIAHGWWLARGGEPVRQQRLAGLSTALVVLLAVGYLRFDVARIEQDAAAAHRRGDCARALSILDGLGAGHRVADSPLTARAENGSAACRLLVTAGEQAAGDRLLAARTLQTYREHPAALWQGAEARRADLFLAQATADLATALTGDTKALETGFAHLKQALKAGQETKAAQVLDGFLGRLPTKDACATRTITDWLAEHKAGDGVLDRAADVVPEVAPAAIVGCGDALAEDKEWKQAKAQYEQLLDQYPKDDLAAKAKEGKERAGLEIELANVKKLLKGSEPEYCKSPAPYHGAPRYRGGGPHRAIMVGRKDHRAKLPKSWLAKDPEDAVLVICAGESKNGAAVRTCPYESKRPFGGPTYVTFRKRKIPVRVYELHSGKRVGPKSVQISGSSCPRRIHYTYYTYDIGPPGDMFVKSSRSDIRAAYGRLIRP